MGTREIDSTVRDTELAITPGRLVNTLGDVAGDWGDLSYLGIHSVTSRPGDIDAALEGTFRHHDERFRLTPPIDWWDAPYAGTNERGFFQNSFTFADLLLQDPHFPEILTSLAAIFVDWLKSNPRRSSSHPHRYAWHDHAAAGRIVPMSFVLREGIRRQLLDRGTCEALAAGVDEHARYLLAEENYAARNNHGFASDAALVLAARTLEPAKEVKPWVNVAERRFGAVLDHMINRDEGLHLEHSPSYHWSICGALGRFSDAGLFKELDIRGLTRRMAESGAWLVAPDGSIPPLGDTPMGQWPPTVATSLAAERSGMKVFPATGYSAVRVGGSALFVTAAHHPTAHKHADDGSFCLYEGGRAIVLDSGCPGYEYESPEFAYGTSPASHAAVCVDGFNWAKSAPAYGSGIVASTERDGLFALLTRNPNAVPGGGAARRTLVYAPTRFLLVIDDVEASGSHQLVRHLPLSLGLEAMATGNGNVAIREGDATLAHLAQALTPDLAPDDVEIVHGRRQPEFGGFRFISPDEPAPGCDLTLSGPAGTPRGLALLLCPDDEHPPLQMTWVRSAGEIEFCIDGLMDSALGIRAGEDSLAIDV